jgi:hypothetical protein
MLSPSCVVCCTDGSGPRGLHYYYYYYYYYLQEKLHSCEATTELMTDVHDSLVL